MKVTSKNLRLKAWSKENCKRVHSFLAALAGLAIFIAALAAIFPDQRAAITAIIYKHTGITESAISVDHLSIDSMRLGQGFSFCPGGFFIELSHDTTGQQFVRVQKDHDVTLRIRKNPLLDETVVIKDIYVDVVKIEELHKYDLIADMNCGAGMTEKLFYIDEGDYKKSNELIIPSRIKTKIHPENEEKFDFITLDENESVDWIRVFIPSPRNSLVRFKLEVVYEVKNVEGSIGTEELYIARTDDVDEWNADEEAVWEIESPARRSAEYKRFLREKYPDPE